MTSLNHRTPDISSISNFRILYHHFPQELGWPDPAEKVRPLRELVRLSNTNTELHKEMERVLEAVQVRQLMLAASWRESYPKTRPEERYHLETRGTVTWRLIVGLGNASPFEVGLALHPLYGIPFIPATAVKGAIRRYALEEIGAEFGIYPIGGEEYARLKKMEPPGRSPLEELERLLLSDELKVEHIRRKPDGNDVLAGSRSGLTDGFSKFAELGTLFRNTFGSTKRRARVVFLDAFPERNVKLEVDVLNPHYGKYYVGNTPPADYHDPSPVFFLTVAKGVQYMFRILRSQQLPEADLGGIGGWIEGTVQNKGLGAKTAAGYGALTVEGR